MTEENPLVAISEPAKTEIQNETIQYVGERNAIVFSAESGQRLPPVELPDDFFDLSQEDVRVLYKELKQTRDDLENMPLRTKAVREMEENAAALRKLRRYTQTVLRVQFPDRLVLQAVFNHSDTIQTVIDFVRTFLDPPDLQFYLYTAPPKCVLQPEVSLLDAKLTPRALVYFGTDPLQDRTSFLQPCVMSSLTSLTLASEAALQYRREDFDEDPVKEEPQKTPAETPSSSYVKSNPKGTSKKGGTASTKVPKWFKP